MKAFIWLFLIVYLLIVLMGILASYKASARTKHIYAKKYSVEIAAIVVILQNIVFLIILLPASMIIIHKINIFEAVEAIGAFMFINFLFSFLLNFISSKIAYSNKS